MILSGYSWADVLSWLIGLLVLYEVMVYVIFTFGKKLFGPSKKGFELDDGSGEETTESRIAHIDEMDDASYENNEFYEIDDQQFEEDTGWSGVVVEEPPVRERKAEVSPDGMYHSDMPDVTKERTESDVGEQTDRGQATEDPPSQSDDDDENEDNDNLPTNVETESTDNPDEIERNFEEAESDIFYSEEELKTMNNGLFSVDNVLETDVLGDSEGADSGNVQNLTSELIETEVDEVNIEKKDINFEGCEPFDSFDFKSLSEELETIKKRSSQLVDSLSNDNKKEQRYVTKEDYEDETPDQELDEN